MGNYEKDFRGFSYGFRPSGSAHQGRTCFGGSWLRNDGAERRRCAADVRNCPLRDFAR